MDGMSLPRHLACLLAAALLAGTAGAAPAAQRITPHQALQLISRAGYTGVGGVAREGGRYYAAALSPEGRRVRVTVDAASGRIIDATPLPRGAGAVTPNTPPRAAYQPPRLMPQSSVPVGGDFYQPPGPNRAIGVVPRPGTPEWLNAPVYCRSRPNQPGC